MGKPDVIPWLSKWEDSPKWEIAGEGLFVELQTGQYESYPEEITVTTKR